MNDLAINGEDIDDITVKLVKDFSAGLNRPLADVHLNGLLPEETYNFYGIPLKGEEFSATGLSGMEIRSRVHKQVLAGERYQYFVSRYKADSDVEAK